VSRVSVKKMRSLKLIADTEPNANNIIRYVKEKMFVRQWTIDDPTLIINF